MGTAASETRPTAKPGIYCADDNPMVTHALRRFIERSDDFRWLGCAEDADQLVQAIYSSDCPDVVLLDIDMPGRDPFEAIADLHDRCPNIRVLMYSGMVKRDLIDRAIEAGAWGYVSKADGEEALFAAIHKALDGEFGLSPEAQAVFGS